MQGDSFPGVARGRPEFRSEDRSGCRADPRLRGRGTRLGEGMEAGARAWGARAWGQRMGASARGRFGREVLWVASDGELAAVSLRTSSRAGGLVVTRRMATIGAGESHTWARRGGGSLQRGGSGAVDGRCEAPSAGSSPCHGRSRQVFGRPSGSHDAASGRNVDFAGPDPVRRICGGPQLGAPDGNIHFFHIIIKRGMSPLFGRVIHRTGSGSAKSASQPRAASENRKCVQIRALSAGVRAIFQRTEPPSTTPRFALLQGATPQTQPKQHGLIA